MFQFSKNNCAHKCLRNVHNVVNPESNNDEIRVPITIFGFHSVACFDTGSCANFLNVRTLRWLCKNVGPQKKIKLNAHSGPLPCSATSQPLQILGSVIAPVCVGNCVKNVEFLVANNLQENVIFGKSAMDKYGDWTYRPSEQHLVLHGVRIPLIPRNRSHEMSEICVAEDCVIPPSHVMHVPLSSVQSIPKEVEFVYTEPHPAFLSGSTANEFLCQPSLCKSNMLRAQVSNFSESPIILSKGQSFGVLGEAAFEKRKYRNRKPGPSVNKILMSDRVKFIKENIKFDPNLTQEEKDKVLALACEFADVFSTGDHDLGCTHLASFTIDTGNAAPIHCRPYRTEFKKRAIIEKEVNRLLDIGLIEPAVSEWSAPILALTKRDGSCRLVVSYVKLNAVTRRDTYCIPRIADILQNFSGSKYFSTFDAYSGYYQIPCSNDLDTKNKTTFTCHMGTYRWRRMPMGAKNSAQTFSRLIDTVLRGLDFAFGYIDDIACIGGGNLDEHLARVRIVLERFRQADVRLKLAKCNIAAQQLLYLGMLIDRKGMRPNPEKVNSIKNLPPPRSVKLLKKFLGSCQFFAQYVPLYSEIVVPLHHLTAKGVKWEWTEEKQQCFDKLKEKLCSAPPLSFP